MSGILLVAVGVGLGLLIPTAYAGKIGAPWAPTRKRAIDRAFDELKLGSHDVVIDLGAGDGKVLSAATARGAKAIGYELSPIMWVAAWVRIRIFPLKRRGRQRGSTPHYNHPLIPSFVRRGRVIYGNFYNQTLPPDTTVIFTFLMPENMPRLRAYLAKQHLPRLKFIVSYAFQFQDAVPIATFREPNCAPVYVYDSKQV